VLPTGYYAPASFVLNVKKWPWSEKPRLPDKKTAGSYQIGGTCSMGSCADRLRLLIVATLLTIGVPVLADQVAPTSNRPVAVRAAANSRSQRVGTLEPGERATVVDDADSRWWNVKLDDGTRGFVSKRSTELVAVSGGGSGEGSGGAADHSGEGWNAFAGYPTCVKGDCQFAVLEKHDFAVGYSETYRDPLWVAYHLFPTDHPFHDDRKKMKWRADDSTSAQIDTSCYTVDQGVNPFDRGHNAPNSAIDGRYGVEAQKDTFLLSNVCPQAACLNEGAWQGFEKVESDDYGQRFSRTWTITGPIFDAHPNTIKCNVQVPRAFYKIVVMNDDGHPAALAVEMSQDERRRTEPVKTFVTTVKHIEDETGLDFFPRLSGADKVALETSQPDARWHVDQVMAPDYPCRLRSE